MTAESVAGTELNRNVAVVPPVNMASLKGPVTVTAMSMTVPVFAEVLPYLRLCVKIQMVTDWVILARKQKNV